MATGGREARRRKILERGSDRLALITGRLQNLPSSPDSDTVSYSQLPDSLPPSSTTALESHLSEPTSLHGDAKSPGLIFPKHDLCSKSFANTVDGGARIGSEPCNFESSIKDLRSLPSGVSDSVGHSSTGPPSLDHKIFNPKQISVAVNASGNMRMFCSVGIAALAVLLNAGFSFTGFSFIRNHLLFRPLLLVLLTNSTIVIAKLLLLKKKQSVAENQGRMGAGEPGSEDGFLWAGQASRVFEAGLVLWEIIDGMFMDCSVYAVVLICGLSLASSLCS